MCCYLQQCKQCEAVLNYRTSSRPDWLFEGRRLLQILLTGSRGLYHWNIKMITYELFKCPNLVPWLIFNVTIYSRRQLELSLISFAGSDSTLTWKGGDKRKRRRQEGWGGGGRLFEGGDYFKYFRLNSKLLRGILFAGRLDNLSLSLHFHVLQVPWGLG